MDNINFMFDDHYLVVEVEDINRVINYQLEMLTHADVKYILPVRKQMNNNRLYLYYDVKGIMALDRLIMHRKMPDTAYVNFAVATLRAVAELEEYQLSADGMVIEDSYIFVHPTEYTPSFVYVPIEGYNGGVGKVVAYLKNMLVSDVVDIKNSSIMQQAISILNSDCSVNEMAAQFERVVGGRAIPTPQPMTTPQPVPQVAPMPQVTPMPQATPASQSASTAIFKNRQTPEVAKPQTAIPNKRNVPNMPAAPNASKDVPQKQNVKKTQANKTKNDKPVEQAVGKPDMKKIAPFMVGAGVAVIVFFAVLAALGTFTDESGQTDFTSFVVVPVIIGAVDYFIYSKLKTKYVVTDVVVAAQKNEKRKVAGHKEKEVFVPVKEIGQTPVPASMPQHTFNQVSQPTLNSTPQPTPFAGGVEQASLFADSGKTEIITDEEEPTPYLLNKHGEKIVINGQITRVGKLKDQVDFVIANTKVSRVHADIIMREGKLYVMDLSSSNGTYLNGNPNRLTGNMEYELHNNDRVVFANEEYTVHC